MIYCVEDDPSIRELEVYTLNSMGMEAEGFEDAKTFYKALEERPCDLVLLDIMLPDQDGLSILKALRSSPRTASIVIVMATAKTTELDKISALDMGADDYLSKPFSMLEMAARIKAVLRRISKPENSSVLRSWGLELDRELHKVSSEAGTIDLTLKEFQILELLMANEGKVFSREKLMDRIWGIEYDAQMRTVDVHIRTLRAKLGDLGDLVETVRGIGYRFRGQQ